MKKTLVVTLLLSFICAGCASQSKSTLLGAATGATLGGMIGSGQAKDHGRGARNGALVGALIGGLVTYLGHKEQAKKYSLQMSTKGKNKNEKVPQLTRPLLRRVFVPGGRKGSEYIQPHYKYIIEKNSTWKD